jgi:hypothetical protein
MKSRSSRVICFAVASALLLASSVGALGPELTSVEYVGRHFRLRAERFGGPPKPWRRLVSGASKAGLKSRPTSTEVSTNRVDSQRRDAQPDWPATSTETRPWTRWWWLGSALDPATITRELETLRAAGFGGVEITPIYGARGHESEFVPYLSDAWVRLLEHTLREARRLGLGVDLATGTGWPFGGPWVSEADAARTLIFKTWEIDGGGRLSEAIRARQEPLVRALGNQVYEVRETRPGEPPPTATQAQPLLRTGARALQITDLVEPIEANSNLQALALEQVKYPKELPLLALIAYSGGQVIDLTARVDADRRVDWTAPAGHWTIYCVFLGWHGKLVERAAPGGEGWVIDHFSRDAIRHYLARFDRALTARPLGVRAFFNDSYEVDDATGQADGTPAFFEAFSERLRYDLRQHLPALVDGEPGDANARVLADYRQAISDLLLKTFTAEWSAWAHRRGAQTRNQAHGSPGNLLDLYAASDIPETEGEEISRSKWASSAGHVAGRRLISAEAATWLGEHFRSTLADVRATVDRFFVAGINHIVYHGTAASPPAIPWPGWLFYASVEFNDRNPWWRDLPALNHYVTRVQSFLQSGAPDHDVLLYYPFCDFAALRGAGRLAHFGGANVPNGHSAFEDARDLMQRRGFTYDFVSDNQLQDVRLEGPTLVTHGGARYVTILMPASRYIPPETFTRVVELARQGTTVLAFRGLAADVSGLADLSRRRDELQRAIAGLEFGAPDGGGVAEARVGRGRIFRGDDLDTLLSRAGIARETLVDRGLQFARRRVEQGRIYFINNPSLADVEAWIPLAVSTGAVVVHDPMRGEVWVAPTKSSADSGLEVRLELPAGESVILSTHSAIQMAPPPPFAAGRAIEVKGPWTLRFDTGGPTLPDARTLDRLSSWTTLGSDDVKAFSGTATYSTRFAMPREAADRWRIDLGRVHESARVRLNGRDLETLIGPHFTLTILASDLRASNVLEVSVTNLMANRIAALDRSGVQWKTFYNVNFPARLPENRGADGLFTAARWGPLPSGLLGPVVLVPLQNRQP